MDADTDTVKYILVEQGAVNSVTGAKQRRARTHGSLRTSIGTGQHSLDLYGAEQVQVCTNPHVHGNLLFCTSMDLHALDLCRSIPCMDLHASARYVSALTGALTGLQVDSYAVLCISVPVPVFPVPHHPNSRDGQQQISNVRHPMTLHCLNSFSWNNVQLCIRLVQKS